MNAKTEKKIDTLVNKLQSTMETIVKSTDWLKDESGKTPLSFEEEARSLQLLLEYRLNTQDIIIQLLNLDHHLLYILGIQPQHSQAMNIERLSFALGSDDLQQLLHALNQLVDSLLRIARRYQHQHENSKKEEHLAPVHQHQRQAIFMDRLSNLVTLQKSFAHNLTLTESELKELVKYETLGPVLDHISALRGPINQFYQAQLHGLEQLQHVYQNFHHPLTACQLADILKKADNALHHLPSIYHLNPNYSPLQFKNEHERLEERAKEKRLRPFFAPH